MNWSGGLLGFQQADRFERSRTPGAEEILQIIQCQTGVYDIFDQDDVPAGDVGVDVLDQPDNTGTF